MPRLGLRIVLIACAAILPLLCAGALLKRNSDHRRYRYVRIRTMDTIGERAEQSVDYYIWANQGGAIYLLNHGYGNAELQRSLLLCEARRCYDWKYLYTRVNNYDLRTRLIAHCTKNFPDDPKVHWAAGQLSLAAGDYELAERELGKTIELAGPGESPVTNTVEPLIWYPHGKPSKLRAFCMKTGISEEHLRGRYACALTLMGKWNEADEQTALAKAANDGARPPLPAENGYYYGDTWKDPDARSDPRTAEVREQILEHRWVQAARIVEDPTWGNMVHYDNLLLAAGAQLLAELGTGVKLGRTATENRDPMLANAPEYNTAEGSFHGELSDLLEADYLPFLLRTDMFADALKHSGRKLDDVLAEVRAVTQPERDSYSDYSNGTLRWR